MTYEILGIRPLLIDKMIHLRSDSVRITTAWLRWLRAVLKLLLHCGCNLKLLLHHDCNLKQRAGLPRHPHISGCRDCGFATNSAVKPSPQGHGRERQRRTGWLAGRAARKRTQAGQPVTINDDEGQKRTMDSWMRIVGLCSFMPNSQIFNNRSGRCAMSRHAANWRQGCRIGIDHRVSGP